MTIVVHRNIQPGKNKPHLYRRRGAWIVYQGLWTTSGPTVREAWIAWRRLQGWGVYELDRNGLRPDYLGHGAGAGRFGPRFG